MAGNSEGAALSSGPGLLQGMGKQGQRAGLTRELENQQVDQSRLDQQRRHRGRSLDDGTQPGLVQRAQEVETALQESCKPRSDGDLGQPVGPQGQGQRTPGGVVGQGVHERDLLRRVAAQGEQLLALVDDEEVRRRHVQGDQGSPGDVHRAPAPGPGARP